MKMIGAGENAMIYVFEGQVMADESTVKEGQLGILTDGEEVSLRVPEDAKGVTQMLILAGDPINELLRLWATVRYVAQENTSHYQTLKTGQDGRASIWTSKGDTHRAPQAITERAVLTMTNLVDICGECIRRPQGSWWP